MRRFCCLSTLLIILLCSLVHADEEPRRTTRVLSGPAHPAPAEMPQQTPLEPRTAVTSPAPRPEPGRPALLEPTAQLEGVGRGMVACFQVQADEAAFWQLVVREVGGPVAQIFEGSGSPPSRIPWDGSLLDGGLAWAGITYNYYLAYADSFGTVSEMDGAAFTLPAYSREDRAGLSFLVPGSQVSPGRRGDPVAAATAGLDSVVEQLNRAGGTTTVRIEVLARDEASALALGEAIRAALAGLLDPADRTVDLYVGAAIAAPVDGTVLITTVPLNLPAS